MINPRKIIRSILSYTPFYNLFVRSKGTSPVNGAYYKNIYDAHIGALEACGFLKSSRMIGELGPGDTCGVGICAILDGFLKYYALDLIEHASKENNLLVLEELRTDYYKASERFEELRRSLEINSRAFIDYIVPWGIETEIQDNGLDLIITNAVMEHVIDLDNTYHSIFKWLNLGGFASHVIDYGGHEFTKEWFEHLYVREKMWKFLMHGRMYPINRFSHSYHLKVLKEVGFEIIYERKTRNLMAEESLIAPNLRGIFAEDDLDISSAHIIVRKPGA